MIAFRHVVKRYGAQTVIEDLSFEVARGELFVLVGASGSGKSTVLRMINRLVPCEGGSIHVDGKDIAEQDPRRLRLGIGYAIQSTGLFPHWTVARNIATVPRLLGWERARIDARVDQMFALLRLDPALAARLPASLSGGQQQRVGVARALAGDPAVVLMDEPFGALDPPTREELQGALQRIQRDTGKTIVFVTHDIDEALRLGDRIAVLDGGTLRQCGTPLELLRAPADARVRDFIGGERPGLRLLGALRVDKAMRAGDAPDDAPAVDAGMSLRQALSRMVESGSDCLRVCDGDGHTLGRLQLADLLRQQA